MDIWPVIKSKKVADAPPNGADTPCKCLPEDRVIDSSLGREICRGCGVLHEIVFDERPSFQKNSDDIPRATSLADSDTGTLTEVRVRSRFYHKTVVGNKVMMVSKQDSWAERRSMSEIDRIVNGDTMLKLRRERDGRAAIDHLCSVLRLSPIIKNEAYELWHTVNKSDVNFYRVQVLAAALVYIAALNHEQYQPPSIFEVYFDITADMIGAALVKFRKLFGIRRPKPIDFVKKVMYLD